MRQSHLMALAHNLLNVEVPQREGYRFKIFTVETLLPLFTFII